MIVFAYTLSAATSAACCALLFRAWRRSRQRLLGAAAICFAGYALNDLLLIADEIIFPDVSLLVLRVLPALLGTLLLVVALTQEDA